MCSWPDHRRFGGVAGAQLVVPLSGAVHGDLRDPPPYDLTENEAARGMVLAVDVLVLDVLGYESRGRRHGPQDLDLGRTLVDAFELGRECVSPLQLKAPLG